MLSGVSASPKQTVSEQESTHRYWIAPRYVPGPVPVGLSQASSLSAYRISTGKWARNGYPGLASSSVCHR